MRAVPRDKGTGFVLVPACALPLIETGVLAKDCYAEIDPNSIDVKAINHVYMELCDRVAKTMSEPGLTQILSRSLRWKGCSCIATLKLLCKDSKSPLQWRNVHGGAPYSFTGLSKWISAMLRKDLFACPHLLKSNG